MFTLSKVLGGRVNLQSIAIQLDTKAIQGSHK